MAKNAQWKKPTIVIGKIHAVVDGILVDANNGIAVDVNNGIAVAVETIAVAIPEV